MTRYWESFYKNYVIKDKSYIESQSRVETKLKTR